jgi:hypothetical protein
MHAPFTSETWIRFLQLIESKGTYYKLGRLRPRSPEVPVVEENKIMIYDLQNSAVERQRLLPCKE